MRQRRHLQSGFTLIEVLVALMIVAIALAALSQGIGQYVYNQAGLKERVVASWVAQNRLIELQSGLLETVEKNQKVTMMGTTWRTELTTENTLVPGLKKAELSVYLQENNTPVTKITSIIGE